MNKLLAESLSIGRRRAQILRLAGRFSNAAWRVERQSRNTFEIRSAPGVHSPAVSCDGPIFLGMDDEHAH